MQTSPSPCTPCPSPAEKSRPGRRPAGTAWRPRRSPCCRGCRHARAAPWWRCVPQSAGGATPITPKKGESGRVMPGPTGTRAGHRLLVDRDVQHAAVGEVLRQGADQRAEAAEAPVAAELDPLDVDAQAVAGLGALHRDRPGEDVRPEARQVRRRGSRRGAAERQAARPSAASRSGAPETHSRTTRSPGSTAGTGGKPASKAPQRMVSGVACDAVRGGHGGLSLRGRQTRSARRVDRAGRRGVRRSGARCRRSRSRAPAARRWLPVLGADAATGGGIPPGVSMSRGRAPAPLRIAASAGSIARRSPSCSAAIAVVQRGAAALGPRAPRPRRAARAQVRGAARRVRRFTATWRRSCASHLAEQAAARAAFRGRCGRSARSCAQAIATHSAGRAQTPPLGRLRCARLDLAAPFDARGGEAEMVQRRRRAAGRSRRAASSTLSRRRSTRGARSSHRRRGRGVPRGGRAGRRAPPPAPAPAAGRAQQPGRQPRRSQPSLALEVEDRQHRRDDHQPKRHRIAEPPASVPACAGSSCRRCWRSASAASAPREATVKVLMMAFCSTLMMPSTASSRKFALLFRKLACSTRTAHVAHQGLDQRLVLLAAPPSPSRRRRRSGCATGRAASRCARVVTSPTWPRVISASFRSASLRGGLHLGARGAEGGLAGAVHVGADAFQDVGQPVHHLLEQVQHHPVRRGQQRRRRALAAGARRPRRPWASRSAPSPALCWPSTKVIAVEP